MTDDGLLALIAEYRHADEAVVAAHQRADEAFFALPAEVKRAHLGFDKKRGLPCAPLYAEAERLEKAADALFRRIRDYRPATLAAAIAQLELVLAPYEEAQIAIDVLRHLARRPAVAAAA